MARGDTRERRLFGRMAVCAAVLLAVFAPSHVPAGENGRGAPPTIDLMLKDAVFLALDSNRRLLNERLNRAVQRFSLRLAENRYRPHITVGPYIDGSEDRMSGWSGRAGVSSKVTLRVPTGGEFAVDWRSGGENRKTLSGKRYFNELGFTFRQPLLRGAGARVDTAALRTARLTEDTNVLALRQATADIVSLVIRSYRDYMQAERRVDIRAKSLERAREQLAVNETLVSTGRMAQQDIVQTEADIASRELDLIAAENRLDAARLKLADILDVDSRTRFRLADRLEVEPRETDEESAVETALANRPDYRRALLAIENAKIRVLEAEDGRRWDLSLSLSATFSGADDTPGGAVRDLGNADYGAGLRLDIPLARISHNVECIGVLRMRKFFCDKGLIICRGVPRCRQSVVWERCVLHALKGARL